MKFQSFRSAIVFASVIVGSVIPSQAFAQTPIYVLQGTTPSSFFYFTGTSTYKFTGSMILNSIGFVTNGKTPESLSYTIKGTNYNVSVASLSNEENGFRWLTISPQSLVENDEVTVTTGFSTLFDGPISHVRSGVTQPSLSTKVSYEGFDDSQGPELTVTNSNLRVSNPGSNVAPEPGTLALALTGGCALVGMFIRRRMSN
jgi:hypothetical protein